MGPQIPGEPSHHGRDRSRRQGVQSVPLQNGLALALREIGRIERTLFTLDWLESPELRRQATAELNKGEARNALARAVCFHRLGRLRDRAAEAQQHRASGLALVTAAIALWNTTYLDRALDSLRRLGESVPDELQAHLAPVGWQHINLTGDYLWDADARIGPDGFVPPTVLSCPFYGGTPTEAAVGGRPLPAYFTVCFACAARRRESPAKAEGQADLGRARRSVTGSQLCR